MKKLFTDVIYAVLRYFLPHDKVVVLRTGTRREKADLDLLLDPVRDILRDRLVVVGLGGSLYAQFQTLIQIAKAKVLLVHASKVETLLPEVLNCTDVLVYNRQKGKLIVKKNKGAIRTYNYPTSEYSKLSPIQSYLVHFSRFGCKASWLERNADELLNGNLFKVLYPEAIIAVFVRFIKFLFAQLNSATKKIFAQICTIFLQAFFKFSPCDKKKIVIRSCHHQYNCNPKAIAEAIFADKDFSGWQFVWLLEPNPATKIEAFPSRLQLVKNRSIKAKWHLATAAVVIDNSVMRDIGYVNRRQIVIQTWHGSLGIKRFDGAWNDATGRANDRKTTWCISNSKFESDVYRDTYWKHTDILELGHPRNTIFFKEKMEIDAKVRSSLGIPADKKIVLYAPTFRDAYRGKAGSTSLNKLSPYSLNRGLLLQSLRARFGGDWCLLNRYHFHLKKFADFKKEIGDSNVINVSEYPDIQDLLRVADVVITDYSSLIFDFLLTGKPAFIFATDLEHYVTQERAFFYPIESTPFPIAETNEDLSKNILTFDSEKYAERSAAFLKDKGCIDGPNATLELIDKIKDKLHVGK